MRLSALGAVENGLRFRPESGPRGALHRAVKACPLCADSVATPSVGLPHQERPIMRLHSRSINSLLIQKRFNGRPLMLQERR